MNSRRSPLRSRPRRVAGQSADEHLHDRALDDILAPILVAVMLAVLAAIEWFRVLRPSPPRPWLLTGMAVIGIGYAAFKIWRNFPRLKALKLARDGERAVAEVLDLLRESGYKVFHDVLGEGFNIDHVLIGKTGIFTIETKTYSKPARGDAVVGFDGDKVTVGGYEPDRDAVAQSRAQASWLRNLLRESTGREVQVRPVVVYPGWYVKKQGDARSDVWVLNPKALSSFLANEPEVLSREDQQLAAFHLSRFVRTT